eukprot:9228624-Pyramimonas_sp.AAC.1
MRMWEFVRSPSLRAKEKHIPSCPFPREEKEQEKGEVPPPPTSLMNEQKTGGPHVEITRRFRFVLDCWDLSPK